ncbi:hypothetical protein C8Q80DRAFT_1276321 [Daedaleopsis nitida]|nr:hypothetical protein C8Q80DRAFT_1276321 [Daedaleopsis nitida]
MSKNAHLEKITAFKEMTAKVRHTARGSRVVPQTIQVPLTIPKSAARSKAQVRAGSSTLPTAEAPSLSQTPVDDGYNDITADDHPLRARRSKSQHDYQREYLEVRDEYLERSFARETLPPDGIASCGHPALWRCRTCHAEPTFCSSCCRDTHVSHPLHRVEFWEGTFYRAAWLRQAGVEIYCGHGGKACPPRTLSTGTASPSFPDPVADPSQPDRDADPIVSAPDDDDLPEETVWIDEDLSDCDDEDADFLAASADGEDAEDIAVRVADLPWIGEPSAQEPAEHHSVFGATRSIVVVDTSGVHELPFTFCNCSLSPPRDDLQLLELGYYPASKNRPRTVFTTRVLDDFLLTNQECHASARNYYNKLRRITNNALPHMVPDRYRELLRVSRQWRVQKMRKWAGFAHRSVPIGPGDLAVKCPACPHPGINLPDDWQQDPEKWKYARAVVLDGNFSARHRPMKHPEDDVPLADGHAFTVTQAPYKQHLATGKEFKEELTCQDHRAVLTAAVNRGKYESTGIGAAACSRHGFFQPHACVDFQQGERQINMDYIVHWILAYLNGLTIMILLYDIMCQYFTHFHQRFKNSPFLSIPHSVRFLRGIGQFHVHGHLPRCYPRFSLNFITGAGVQDGEIIETLWNKLNGIADSARGMGTAHRHEMIDDIMNDSNWAKLTRIVPAMIQKWKRVCKELPLATHAYDSLTAAADPQDISTWTSDAARADITRDEDIEAMDIYDVHGKPLPTQKEIQMDLMDDEMRELDTSSGGAASWLSTGLKLEQRKMAIAYSARRLRTSAGESERLGLLVQRQKLTKAIAEFQKAARTHLRAQNLADGICLPRILPTSEPSGTI